MKKNFSMPFITLIFLTLFMLTSCVDYIQSISYRDGKYQIYHKITLSKVLMAMGDSEPDDFLSEDSEYNEMFPESARPNKIDTDLEYGFESSFSVSPKNCTPEEKKFLPTSSGTKRYIPFTIGKDIQQPEFSEDDYYALSMMQAILSSAKCRVLISKKIIPDAQSAYFEGTDSKNWSLPLYDYGDSFCVEVPFALLIDSQPYRFDRLVLDTEPLAKAPEPKNMENSSPQTVYWTEDGNEFHTHEDCENLSTFDLLICGTEQEARNAGKSTLCPDCEKRDAADN